MSDRQTSLYELGSLGLTPRMSLWGEPGDRMKGAKVEFSRDASQRSLMYQPSDRYCSHVGEITRRIGEWQVPQVEVEWLNDYPCRTEETVWTKLFRNSERPLQNFIEERFSQLANKWRDDVMFLSDPSEMVMNINYLRIVALGESAIPFIKSALEESCEHWFVALEAITGHTPEPAPGGFTPASLRNYWLDWLSHNR